MRNSCGVCFRNFCRIGNGEFYPSSSVKIYKRKGTTKLSKNSVKPAAKSKEPICNVAKTAKNPAPDDHISVNIAEYAENSVKIQMISHSLHSQIFPSKPRTHQQVDAAKAAQSLRELRRHGLDTENGTERLEDVRLKLPPLHGQNIEEHFYSIAKEQVAPYEAVLLPLVEAKILPAQPKQWVFAEGWTMYDSVTGAATAIEYPAEQGLVLDVEVCVRSGPLPVMATAVGKRHWYSWLSKSLVKAAGHSQSKLKEPQRYTIDDLIPLSTQGPKVVVGHNVCYDRARLREPYLQTDSNIRFIDTMSLHMCVSGITSYQRAMLKAKNKTIPLEDEQWRSQSALNSLAEVQRLYCGGTPLDKEPRNVFVEGNLQQVRANWQDLINYCASDVAATWNVLRVLYPLYAERFPHPVTLAGMLELGSAYLPVNANWQRYLREADLAYEDLSIEAKYHLARRADASCGLLADDAYRKNLWLWDEDWSVQQLKLKQPKVQRRKAMVTEGETNNGQSSSCESREASLERKYQPLHDMRSLLPARRPLLPGYPAWYRKLCEKPAADDNDWRPGASTLSTGMQIAPKLLALCWEGYPLHYLKDHGWGFLVPFRNDHSPGEEGKIPITQLVGHSPVPDYVRAAAEETEVLDYPLQRELDAHLGKREYYAKAKNDSTSGLYKGSGVWCNVVLEQCCYFIKLPHKSGPSHRVGNPLSRDFLNKFVEHVLSSAEGEAAERVIQIARMSSYWRNNRQRIRDQLVVWLPKEAEQGAICPMVVACGTLTRRAMEPTWLTASNAQRERIGSELRAMVQAPHGYRIVGADVDSQELWIASVLGDAHATGMHGATPLGWMTLSGSKARGSDMHTVTAKAVGISRDHSKVLNYARIYGAGQQFAETLLKQFNPMFSAKEAKAKAAKMFSLTKGKRIYRVNADYKEQYGDGIFSGYEALQIASANQRPVSEIFERPTWHGGTESAMFNRLEEIATQSQPATPFLGCRLSRALETDDSEASRFLPTRVNWVVQSGAVDFLHLMLVCMRWLMQTHVRFCLSFHDEVRYLVKEELAYKAALAMHVTNLLTRSFCAARIGLHDLPMSVAFFSSVEVDRVLRKECNADCQTPSNPHGLSVGYGIPPGESVNIYEAIASAGGSDLTQWEWLR